LLHVTLQTNTVTQLLNTLRSQNSQILSINYDTYMSGLQNIIAQTANSSGYIETTTVTIFYCENQTHSPLSNPLQLPPLEYKWESFQFTSYPNLIDKIIGKCDILQYNGYDIYNIQLDTFLPALDIRKINETNTLIWYSKRKANDPEQPSLKVSNENSRLNGHRHLIKKTAKFISNEDITVLNVNIDTYTPFFLKIFPEKTHICTFYV